MYWYRDYRSLGRCSIVGSTVKTPERFPENLMADEKHTWWKGERVYIPTTVAQGCLLGASLTTAASKAALCNGYREFVKEAQALQPGYNPQTVNTDDWELTQQAWHSLFPTITVISCFASGAQASSKPPPFASVILPTEPATLAPLSVP